jgi:sugar (pentulose or hexulose) kinase
MLPTLVELDGDGVPLSPAITWEDARAEADAEAFLDAVGADEVYRITGQRLDGRYLAPMHARLRRLGLAGRTVAGAKDALFHHLTGELLTDPSTAAGTGVFDLDGGCWNAELVAASGIPRLPELAPATTARPLLTQWCNRWGTIAGLPVVLGAADSVLGAIGMGAGAAGDVAVIAGTSAIVLGIADSPVRDHDRRYLVTPMAGEGWGLEMDVLSVGSAFGGIARLLGLPGPAALLDAAACVTHDAAPMFLPYLTPGEQGALWDPNVTGTLHGLTLAMSAGHVGRALLTGVVVELRRCTNVLEVAAGDRGPILVGGGAAGPLMWQDLANATGREVHVDPHVDDPSALGAAMLAACAVGASIVRSGSRTIITPDPGAAEWWSEAAGRHDALRRTLGGLTARQQPESAS